MYLRHVGAPALRGTFGGEPTRLYRGVPSARRAFCSAKRGGAHRGSTVAAARGITTKATSLFIAISTYISHTYTEDRENGRRRWRKLERTKERERRYSHSHLSFSPPVFFLSVSLSPPISFPHLPFPVMHLHPARLTPVAM